MNIVLYMLHTVNITADLISDLRNPLRGFQEWGMGIQQGRDFRSGASGPSSL